MHSIYTPNVDDKQGLADLMCLFAVLPTYRDLLLCNLKLSSLFKC